MATTQAGGGELPSPRRCANAEVFVRRRLDGVDDPLSPAELAEEYDCSNVHMRQVVADLAADGEIHRVARGMYVADADDLPEEPTGQAGADTSDHTDSSDAEAGDSPADPVGPADAGTPEVTAPSAAEAGDLLEEPTEDAGGLRGLESVPVDPRTFLMLLAVATVAYLALRVVSGGSSTSVEAEESDEELPPPPTDGPSAGGLV